MLLLFHSFAKPLLRSSAMALRGAGFLLSQIPPEPLWPTAAKDCSSVHAGDQQSHPEWSTCQNPNAADCPQGKAQFFHLMHYVSHSQDKILLGLKTNMSQWLTWCSVKNQLLCDSRPCSTICMVIKYFKSFSTSFRGNFLSSAKVWQTWRLPRIC